MTIMAEEIKVGATTVSRHYSASALSEHVDANCAAAGVAELESWVSPNLIIDNCFRQASRTQSVSVHQLFVNGLSVI